MFGAFFLILTFSGNSVQGTSPSLPKILWPRLASSLFEATVSGRVTDQKDEPIPGVIVSIEGGSIGTVTDLDGMFSLEVSEQAVLVFSFIGYQTQQISVKGQSIFNVTLMEEVNLGADPSDLDPSHIENIEVLKSASATHN